MLLTSINAELLQLQAILTPKPFTLPARDVTHLWEPITASPQPPAADVSNLLLISSYSVRDELVMTHDPGACRILTLSN